MAVGQISLIFPSAFWGWINALTGQIYLNSAMAPVACEVSTFASFLREQTNFDGSLMIIVPLINSTICLFWLRKINLQVDLIGKFIPVVAADISF